MFLFQLNILLKKITNSAWSSKPTVNVKWNKHFRTNFVFTKPFELQFKPWFELTSLNSAYPTFWIEDFKLGLSFRLELIKTHLHWVSFPAMDVLTILQPGCLFTPWIHIFGPLEFVSPLKIEFGLATNQILNWLKISFTPKMEFGYWLPTNFISEPNFNGPNSGHHPHVVWHSYSPLELTNINDFSIKRIY